MSDNDDPPPQLTQEQQDRNELLGQDTGDQSRIVRELRAQNLAHDALNAQITYIGEGLDRLTEMNVRQLENQEQLIRGQEQAQHERQMILRGIDAVDLRVKKGFESLTQEALTCFNARFYLQNPLNIFYCIFLLLCWLVLGVVNAHRLYVRSMISVMRGSFEVGSIIPYIGPIFAAGFNSVVLSIYICGYVFLLGTLLSSVVDENLTNEVLHTTMISGIDRLSLVTYNGLKELFNFFFTGHMFTQIRDVWNATTGKFLRIFGGGIVAVARWSVCNLGNWFGSECTQLDDYSRWVEEVMTNSTIPNATMPGGGIDSPEKFKSWFGFEADFSTLNSGLKN